MKVIALKAEPTTYSCIPYLVLGTWNAIDDVNTLIDPGPDSKVILEQLGRINTGLGKNPVDQIIFTHGHYDHAGCAPELKKHLNCRLCGNFQADYLDKSLNNGEKVRIGDEEFEVIHAPYHSDDSICLYCQKHKVIFTGDTTVRIQRSEVSFSNGYRDFIGWLARTGIKTIYGGHDPPLNEEVQTVLDHSMRILNLS